MKPTEKFENQFIGPVILTAAEISCCENSSATIYQGTPPIKTKTKTQYFRRKNVSVEEISNGIICYE